MFVNESFEDDFFKQLPLGFPSTLFVWPVLQEPHLLSARKSQVLASRFRSERANQDDASQFQKVPAGKDAFRRGIPLASPKLETNEEFIVVRAKMRPAILVMPEIPPFGVDNRAIEGKFRGISLLSLKYTVLPILRPVARNLAQHSLKELGEWSSPNSCFFLHVPDYSTSTAFFV